MVDLEHAAVDDPAAHPVPPGALELDAPDGPHLLDVPTVDSDGDGTADTVVTVSGDGVELATDLDGDTHVDVVTTIDDAGTAHTVELGPSGMPPAWDEGVPGPPPVLDPRSGRWMRTPE